MRIRVPVLLLPLLAGFALALGSTSARAGGSMCACAAGFPLTPPTLCYAAPGAQVADFAYTAPGSFLQVVGFGARGYCRHNGAFQWLDAAGVGACEAFIGCRCDNPSPGVEVCDDGIDNDCDGATDFLDSECAALCPCFGLSDGPRVTWNSSFEAVACVQSGGNGLALEGPPAIPEPKRLGVSDQLPQFADRCWVDDEDTAAGESVDDLTDEEVQACIASLRAIATEDDVVCPVPANQ